MMRVIFMYERIRNLREDRDMTQAVLATKLNISQTTYSRYENGVLDIPSNTLVKLANFHNTSVDYLLNVTDDKIPYRRK
jgi:transcriptional regulator with XRE-family HTH domain